MLLRINSFFQDGKLSYEDFINELRASEECGSKIIYLKHILDFAALKDDKVVSQILDKLPAARGKDLKTLKLPGNPTLNYKIFDENEIRIKFSETQTKFIEDYETLRLVPEDVTNVVVFSVNRQNGQSLIYFDTPNRRHSHTDENGHSSDLKYLGLTQLTRYLIKIKNESAKSNRRGLY
ncbi:MAG: hypothetical protein H7Y42_06175 [Chitinophagaceae bacterium]|nr:hypothetical protein [Chitinophagaceae bacterium]